MKFKDIYFSASSLNCVESLQCEIDRISVFTDSREFDGGDEFFVALVGEKYDAHDFIDQLVLKGCKNFVLESDKKILIKNSDDLNIIWVKNTVRFLQELAGAHRLNSSAKVIAISGSNGKTTTKEMLSHILSGLANDKIIKTIGNNNNHLGVAYTVLSINSSTEFAIVELGSNHPGEMDVIAEIAKPDYLIITNVGETHMEFFPTLQDVCSEESAPIRHLKSDKSIFFQNLDDELLAEINESRSLKFSSEKGFNYQLVVKGKSVELSNDENTLKIENEWITGRHNFWNLGVAVMIVHHLNKYSFEDIKRIASEFRPRGNRGEWITLSHSKVFLDAYNANPSSMLASIEGFIEEVKGSGSILIVLGDMNELGDHTEIGHKKVSSYIKKQENIDAVFIGRYSSYYQEGFNEGKCYKDALSYKAEFNHDSKKYDYIFIKGSRSLQLESLIDIK